MFKSFLLSFFKAVPFMTECTEVWCSQTGHRGQNDTAHALGMLDN
jgi:hypothetical protein